MKFTFALTGMLAATLCACTSDNNATVNTPNNAESDTNTAKYVFLFIGDGMAAPQIGATENALESASINRTASNDVITATDKTFYSDGTERLNMSYFPIVGSATTYAEDRLITDSAAAGTALATGSKTTVGTIAMNGDASENITTIAELAHNKGMAVGIVSSVDIDHATPASFYAHSPSRNYYNYIAAQMATSGFEYFAGGHAKGNNEKYHEASRNPEGWEAQDIHQAMSDADYTIATGRDALNSAIDAGGKVWAYSDYSADYSDDGGWGALSYTIDNSEEDVTLAEFTQAGIELLSNDEDGFFMMVEGGKIDWALHANDAVAAAQDTVAFDEAIGKAIAFYNEHPDDTLIIVTGDHETGGMTLGASESAYASNYELLQYQTISSDRFGQHLSAVLPETDAREAMLSDDAALEANFAEVLALLKTDFGLGNCDADAALALSEYENSRLLDAYLIEMGDDIGLSDSESYLNYGGYSPITVTAVHILNEKAGVAFTSYSHTAVPVPVFALGNGENAFSGSYDNTNVAQNLISAVQLSVE